MELKVHSNYKPQGDQASAIEQLTRGLREGEKHQVLLGVTGSGKTFTMAKVIEECQRPALVMAHNKTLAAQLYHEFKSFFPNNAVEYFVSYYDYYQPEAYIPAGDIYIEKESTVNDELDKLRLSATRSLFERRDCIIVASVSCIYGLGSPEAYYGMLLFLEKGQKIKRKEITSKLVEILYERTDGDFKRGTFRVRGDVIEVYPDLRRQRLPHRAVGRRGRVAVADRSALWHREAEVSAAAHLSEIALRDEAGDEERGGRFDCAGDAVVGEGAGKPGAHRGGAAHPSAHALRPGDDQGDGLLPRH